MGARLFTAVLPPEEVLVSLDQLLEPRRASDERLRWTRPIGWHLTTSFMGDVAESRIEDLIEALELVGRRHEPFELGLGGAVAFPAPDRAKVLGLAVGQGSDELGRLSAGCRSAATRAGVAVDGARFVGHLTVARARPKAGFNATRWLEILGSFPAWKWVVSEFCLVQSHSMGRDYEVLTRVQLCKFGASALD